MESETGGFPIRSDDTAFEIRIQILNIPGDIGRESQSSQGMTNEVVMNRPKSVFQVEKCDMKSTLAGFSMRYKFIESLIMFITPLIP